MTWKQLVRDIAAQVAVPMKTTEAVLDTFIETLSREMLDPEFERLVIPRIGTFSASWSAGRIVRSPKDSKRVFVDGRWRIAFRPAESLKQGVAVQSSQLWRRADHQAAWRLAETLVSDLEMYHPTVTPSGVREPMPDADVRAAAEAAFGAHWLRALKTYEQEVPAATRAERDHLAAAVRKRWSVRERKSGSRRRRAKTQTGSVATSLGERARGG